VTDLPRSIAARLSSQQLADLADALRAFPTWVRARGEDYALGARVGEERLDAGDVLARVRGSRVYAVRWRLHERGADPLCTCPAAPICKHAFAVGMRVLAAARVDGATLPPEALELLPRLWRRDAPAPLPGSLDRSAAAGEPRDPRLRALREAGSGWLRLEAAKALLARAQFGWEEIARLPLEDVAYEDDPDVRCWRLARLAGEVLGRVPRPLEPFAAREDLAARAAESARRHVVERLSDWALAQSREERHLRLVLGLLPANGPGPARVTLQARLTSPRLHDEPRSTHQLNQLRAESRRDPRLFSPPQARLLRLVTENEMGAVFGDGQRPGALGNEHLNLLLDRAAGSPFVTWSDRLPPDLAVLAGIEPGGRARLDGDDLRLVLDCRETEGGLRLGLALVDGSGRARPADPRLMWPAEPQQATSQPSIVLEGGAFHRVVEEPPADIVRTLAELRGLPLRREDGPLLDRLASRSESVARALRALTRTHAARPAIALELTESDWVCVRLFAHTARAGWAPGRELEPGARLFEHTPAAGWVPIAAVAAPGGVASLAHAEAGDGPAQVAAAGEDATAAEVGAITGDVPAGVAGAVPWRETPDPARVAPALAWLEELGATPGDRRGPGGAPPPERAGEGWWLRLTPRTAERLETAWRERPGGIEWFGNRAARELLAGGRSVRARVSVLASGLDWLSVRAEWESEGLALTDADLARLRSARETFVRLPGGWVRREQAEAHDAIAAALADLGIEAGAGEQRLSAWQLAQARPESLGALVQAGADGETLAAVRRIREAVAAFTGLPRVEGPRGFRGELRPYQRDGLDFLVWTSSMGLGAVLADDMGLGKTVQALVWLEHLRERDPHGGPALVVCPASVMHNWVREAARFTPGLRVLALGSGRERRARLREAPAYDLVITNYALLRRDIEQWRGIALRAAILDEAQNVKNPDAAVTRATLELAARHRLALTGTPLENRALDLWSILAFVNRGWLGPRQRFVQRYDRPDAPPHLRRLLSARLRPVLLRRLKEQVERDLPARIEERLDCELTPGQRKLYLAELVRARRLLRSVVEGPEEIARKRIVILAVLTQLRQICCHPALVGGERSLGSGKFDALFELLEPLRAEGQKVLVFSQFVRCLELIADALRRRGLRYHTLTGRTSTARREQVLQEFAEDPEPCVFLVSLKAGGTGLNLTAANHVVLFDPWWNPAVEAQAIDRTHRIGQTRAVVAYRLYAEGTIEERIADLKVRKAQLARDVLGEDALARALTREDLEFLLSE